MLFRDGARPDPAKVTRYIEARRDAFGVEPICRALGVPVSTHYARRSRKPSARELADRELLARDRGGPRGLPARLRRAQDLEGAAPPRRRGRPRPGRAGDAPARARGQAARPQAADDDRRTRRRSSGPAICCSATSRRPRRTRSGSPTSPTSAPGAGFVYLAFILDCYSRMIVGWQLATHMRTELVLDALEMANGLRRPAGGPDRAYATAARNTRASATPTASTSSASRPRSARRGDAYDNAMAEAWVATFKSELVDGRRFPSFEHAEHEALALDRLLQRRATARSARRLAARRVRSPQPWRCPNR